MDNNLLPDGTKNFEWNVSFYFNGQLNHSTVNAFDYQEAVYNFQHDFGHKAELVGLQRSKEIEKNEPIIKPYSPLSDEKAESWQLMSTLSELMQSDLDLYKAWRRSLASSLRMTWSDEKSLEENAFDSAALFLNMVFDLQLDPEQLYQI